MPLPANHLVIDWGSVRRCNVTLNVTLQCVYLVNHVGRILSLSHSFVRLLAPLSASTPEHPAGVVSIFSLIVETFCCTSCSEKLLKLLLFFVVLTHLT